MEKGFYPRITRNRSRTKPPVSFKAVVVHQNVPWNLDRFLLHPPLSFYYYCFAQFKLKRAVADLGRDEAQGRVEFDAEVPAEWGCVDRIISAVDPHRKSCRHCMTVHRFDRDDVVGSAEMEIDGGRFAEHLIASFV